MRVVTVYTLWKNTDLLPLLHTHPPVLTKIQTGADLMIPGLIGPPFPAGATKGRLVAIASSESPTVPLVVGVCEINVSGLTRVVGEKGKAVRVVHWVGDEIFNNGGAGGKIPESLEWGDEVSKAAKGLGDLSLENKPEEDRGKGKGKEGTEADTGEEAIRELTTKGSFLVLRSRKALQINPLQRSTMLSGPPLFSESTSASPQAISPVWSSHFLLHNSYRPSFSRSCRQPLISHPTTFSKPPHIPRS